MLKDKQKSARGRTGKGNVACGRTLKLETAQCFFLKYGSLTFLNFGVAGCKRRGKWQKMRWAKLARRSP